MASRVQHRSNNFIRACFVALALCIPAGVPLCAEGDGPVQRRYIREYLVVGAREVPRAEIEEAVYPFLGPARTTDDVERARTAVERLYHEKGFQAASVEIPVQEIRRGVVVLQVHEGRVGRLRVKGARYFSPGKIRERARSLAEGRAINFTEVNRDIVALNQLADRQVTPKLTAGAEPGTVDIDLEVKDSLPLHGSLELNNRYSANTTPLRLNASLSYNNLWQLGHSIGGSYQFSPEEPEEVQVLSGYYLARLPQWESLSVMLQGNKQDSNVSTLGAVAVAGKGESVGGRLIYSLPAGKGFMHSIAFGMDYKRYRNVVTMVGEESDTPLYYYPFTLGYNALFVDEKAVTEFNTSLVWSFRSVGSDSARFDENRYGSDGNFFYWRGDASRTQKLPKGFELFGKLQGQLASAPLVSGEQFGGGGLGTVRGYLEAEVVGDNAAFGSIEFRTPEFTDWLPGKDSGVQFYLFGDAGILTLIDPLPEQESEFSLASVGVGSRVQLFNYFNGAVDAAIPLVTQMETRAGRPFLSFRVWADF